MTTIHTVAATVNKIIIVASRTFVDNLESAMVDEGDAALNSQKYPIMLPIFSHLESGGTKQTDHDLLATSSYLLEEIDFVSTN